MIITKNYRLREWSGGIMLVEPDSYGNCPDCGSRELKYRDYCYRICKEIDADAKSYFIISVKCEYCGRLHRILSDFMRAYGQYSSKAVRDVVAGEVSNDDVIEYPCQITMNRWKNKSNE